MNILTGVMKESSGSARIYDLDIGKNIESIRKIISVVPQFDILWEDLTVYEHMMMFSQLKQIKSSKLKSSIHKRLSSVGLEGEKKTLIKALSGGMRRRLSIAIASIANPKIIFLDEPTTGILFSNHLILFYKAWIP
jgi:ATP-binding cassette, subfamily A (ABC1), member 3